MVGGIEKKGLAHIFRSYDIRGIYKKDLDEKIMQDIGKVIAGFADEDIIVGMDMRASSKSLREALINGITTKKNVHDAGLVPIGVAMFYAWKKGLTLAYITASHLTKEWNGVKFFHPDGVGYVEEENLKIRDIFMSEDDDNADNIGKITLLDTNKIIETYKKYLLSKISINRNIKVVLDCGNGMASIIAPQVFREAGCEVFTLFDELNGEFPNRDPEPTDKTVNALKEEVKKRGADLGVAYDGDADRMLIVDDKPKTVTPEQVAYLILPELMKKERGPIVANVECTRAIDDIANQFERDVFRIKVGHPYLVHEAKKKKAIFGLETSGHFVLPSLVPFDDSLAVSLYAAHTLSNKKRTLSSIVDEIPKYYFERINFECSDEKKFDVIEKLKSELKEHKLNTLDGVRVDFPDGWILIRASNTSPLIRLTVEGSTKEAFEELKKEFTEKLKSFL